MKKVFLVFFTFIFITNCKEKSSAKLSIPKETNTINTLLDKWHIDAAETNFEAYFEAMSNQSVFVGTDATEIWSIQEFKDFSKPYFDKGAAWNFKAINRNIYIDNTGEIAWFDELLNTWMGICRGSGVLKKIDSIWKIEHYVLSLTVPNENIQEVIKINKTKDSIFLKNYSN